MKGLAATSQWDAHLAMGCLVGDAWKAGEHLAVHLPHALPHRLPEGAQRQICLAGPEQGVGFAYLGLRTDP